MTENTAPVVAHLGQGTIEFGGTQVAISSTPLPVIYFDSSPSLSHMNGIIGVTLVVTGNVPNGNVGTIPVASVVAHLKCNIPAARALIATLNSALLLAEPVEKPEGKVN